MIEENTLSLIDWPPEYSICIFSSYSPLLNIFLSKYLYLKKSRIEEETTQNDCWDIQFTYYLLLLFQFMEFSLFIVLD